MGIETHTPPPPPKEPPPIEDMVTALRSLAKKGLPVSPERAPDVLLALRGVYARSINPDDYLSRVKALNLLLTRMLMELGDGEEPAALRAVLALPAENRGLTLTERRRRAARIMGYGETHFRKHVEERLLRDFAWFLHEDSQNYTPRSRGAPPKMEISGDTPSLSAADVNEHEELVSRIWALVYELRAEMIRRARLEAAGDESQTEELEDAEGTSLWLVARLLTRIHEYLDAYGDSILHGEAEFQVESLIKLAGWSGGVTSTEAQRFRLALASAEGRDGFVRALKIPVSPS